MSKFRQARRMVLIVLASAAIFMDPVPIASQSSPASQTSAGANLSPAEGRHVVEQVETEWARARVRVDKETFEKMLAPGFYAQLPEERWSREQFIKNISETESGIILTRFDNRVLTVHQEGDTWVGLIEEKLEVEFQDANGKKTTGYVLATTRDAWKKFGDQWKALFSEVVDMERWKGERPPIKDW